MAVARWGFWLDPKNEWGEVVDARLADFFRLEGRCLEHININIVITSSTNKVIKVATRKIMLKP